MRRIQLHTCLLLVAMAAWVPRPAAASLATAVNQQIPPGARAAAMGNAYTAIAEGGHASWWNPGAFALLDGVFVDGTRSQLVPDLADDIWFRVGGLAAGYRGLGLGFQYTHLSYGEASHASGQPDWRRESYEHTLAVGGGIDLLRWSEGHGLRLGLGGNMKAYTIYLPPYWHASPETHPEEVADIDLGALGSWRSLLADAATPTGGLGYLELRVGVALKNLFNARISYEDAEQSDPLGRWLRSGFAVELGLVPPPDLFLIASDHLVRLILAAEREQMLEPDADYVVGGYGAELSLLNVIALRGGWIEDPDGDITEKTWGFGLGVELDLDSSAMQSIGGSFDYASVPQATGLDRVERWSLCLKARL